MKAKETDQLRLSCERYKTQMHKLEFQASELAASLKRRDAQIEELANQRDEVRNGCCCSVGVKADFYTAQLIPRKYARLFCRAVTSILGQWLLHKMTNSRQFS